MKFTKHTSLKGEITVPGDKSISHRAVMFGALAEGTTEVTNFLQGADCLSTISCFRQLGIEIENTPTRILIHGRGLYGLTAPYDILNTGNSGTTTRLLSGILCGQKFESILNGDVSIQSRPMKRIMEPLTMMGADIESLKGNGCAPLHINGNRFCQTCTPLSMEELAAMSGPEFNFLHSINYTSPVASAQVKSCILLAGLYADSPTSVTEPQLSRDHTERMLTGFGADIRTEGSTATIQPDPKLHGMKIEVPGDISSAAYFIAAALMVPGSELLIKNVGVNPTRDGMLRAVREMGGDVSLLNEKTSGGEPTADLLVKHSALHGITIGGGIIPALIDELPVLAVLACAADGTTVIKDAQELKVKESDRIAVMAQNLSAMGARVTATEDGLIIEGSHPLHGAAIQTYKDHRIAMSFAVASLIADGETEILDANCVNISYPNFYETLNMLQMI